MPVTGAAVGLDPFGFPLITAAPEPEPLQGPFVRHISPSTGDYELTANGRRFKRTTSIRQRVYLALATRRDVSPVLRNFGLRLPGRVNVGSVQAEVRRALNQMAVVEGVIRIRSIDVSESETLGRVAIFVTYVPVGQRDAETVTIPL